MTIIELQAIDPSPFQRRQHFEEDKLKGLAAIIQRDGLIEPIVVRPNGKGYQLIAGERRWRAIRDYTDMEFDELFSCPLSILERTDAETLIWEGVCQASIISDLLNVEA
jgi:ParB family chromosome partitioning protein